MCGIAGILGATFAADHLATLTKRMQAALHQRGPDDAGIYLSADRQAALTHTRLAILDLSAAGHQPMATPDQRYWITFNGEIYNFRDLRQQLVGEGETFYSQTDTEVILKLYQRWGPDCVHHLRGMFAFAIWDDWTKTGFLARDPLGIKPLYYWRSGTMLGFASELRALLASGLPKIAMNATGLYGYLISGSVPEPHTLIQDIACLPAGHWLQWQAGQVNQSQYWQIQFAAEPIAPADAVVKVRAALIDSLHHHFVSDVPVGVFLSGGIDSTALVALAQQYQSEELRTYSIAFEEAAWNEGSIAQTVAQQFATVHTELTLTAAVGRSLLPQFLTAIDQPSVDGFNTYCVSQLAHQAGTKVVLSGLGGDELFGGYASFRKVPQMVAWGQTLHRLKPLNTLVGLGLEHLGPSGALRRLGDFLQHDPSMTNAYQSFRGIFSHAEAAALVQHYLPERTRPADPTGDHFPPQPSPADAVSQLEISGYMQNQLLRNSDVMSMAWGLELRVPFVDRTLLEAITPIPSQLRLAPGKQLLTQAVPELPDYVVNRPKQGFAFPFDLWMQTEWQDYFQEVNCPRGISLQRWYRRWCLVMLHQWWQRICPGSSFY
jgi:asparagine synthase (glutamine-hydrolysing)